MNERNEIEQELILTLYDLISQVAALQCFLHSHGDSELFCAMPDELSSYYLRMVTDYIAQYSNDVLALSRRLTQEIREMKLRCKHEAAALPP